MTYSEIYQSWQHDPTGFWASVAGNIDWYRKWDTVLDETQAPIYRWFKGATVNTCYNALDRHVENGRAEQPALIYDSPLTNTIKTFSYRELRDEVAKLAGAIRSLGVETGDRVVIYMPMIPEAAMAMLACARIGAVHSVVFGGFAANVLAEVVQMVRDQIGPVAAFKKAAVVAKLPKTRSGKILRRTIKAIAEHTPYKMPATIDDSTALLDVEQAMQQLGYTETKINE